MTWKIFHAFKEDMPEKVHNLGADTLKIALTNTLPNQSTHSVLTDITQIASTGTYAPITLTVNTSAQAGGTYSLTHDAASFTPSGADYASARYWVVYNDTAATDELIAYYDYGVSYAAPDGQPWTLNAGTLFTLA